MNRFKYFSQNVRSSLLQSSKGYHSSGLIAVRLTNCIRLHTVWAHDCAPCTEGDSGEIPLHGDAHYCSQSCPPACCDEGGPRRYEFSEIQSEFATPRGRSLVSNLRHDPQSMHDTKQVMSRARSDTSKIACYDSQAQKNNAYTRWAIAPPLSIVHPRINQLRATLMLLVLAYWYHLAPLQLLPSSLSLLGI